MDDTQPPPEAQTAPEPPPAATSAADSPMSVGAPAAEPAADPAAAPDGDAPPARDPILERILADPDIRAARENGQFHRLYRLLARRRRRTTDPAERPLLDGLLANRRLFLEPLTGGAPALYTLNGFGTMLYGQAERDPGNLTYIGTQWLTAIFIPLVPLKSFLAAPGDTADSYFFLARAPLSRGLRLWRWLLGLGSVGLVLYLIANSMLATALEGRFSTLHVVNDLDLAVTVGLGALRVPLGPGARHARVLKKGRYHLTVRDPGGRALDEEDVTIPGGADAIVYNVLGASPVYYRAARYDERAPERFELLAGQRLIVKAQVDDLFAPPPREQQFDSALSAYRNHLDRAPGGWRTSLALLARQNRALDGARLAERLSAAMPAEPVLPLTAAHLYLAAGQPDAALRLTERLVAGDAGIEVHRAHQHVLERLGRIEECRRLYRERAAAQPGSATAAYLAVRPQPLAERVRLYPELVARFPADAELRAGYGVTLLRAERYAEAARELAAATAADPRAGRLVIEDLALALAAAGRPRDAMVRLAPHLDPRAPDLDLVTLYARLARLPGPRRGEAPRPLADLLAQVPAPQRPSLLAALAARLDEPPPGDGAPDDRSRAAAELTRDVIHDLPRALRVAREAPTEVLGELPLASRALLAAEFARTGVEAAARRLIDSDPRLVRLGPALLDATVPADPATLDVEPELRAVAFLAAARRSGDERARGRLIDEARRRDVLTAEVTAAILSWPSP